MSPSLHEGRGLTLLEAQASGIPVVAFSVGAVPENVLHCKTGIPGGREMAGAILKILTDRTLKDNMSREGRKFSVKNFSWKKCAERMQVYTELAEGM